MSKFCPFCLQTSREYERKLSAQKEDYEHQIRTLKSVYENKLEKLHDQVFEIAKTSNMTTSTTITKNYLTINIINQIGPDEFDVRQIRRIIERQYPEESEFNDPNPTETTEYVVQPSEE
jgi:dynactin complex subunit